MDKRGRHGPQWEGGAVLPAAAGAAHSPPLPAVTRRPAHAHLLATTAADATDAADAPGLLTGRPNPAHRKQTGLQTRTAVTDLAAG